ncbi:MAG: hypothetical protein KDA32_11025, partial [Phycisphaerales bacterium]|nr:hypothetical protein [Phycisphaerales bacterium]
MSRVSSLMAAALGLSLIGGCPAPTMPAQQQQQPTDQNDTSVPPMSTVQRSLSGAGFAALRAADTELADAVAYAKSHYGADRLIAAGTVGEADGAQIDWASYESGGAPIVVVRHCESGDCASGVVVPIGGDDVAWETSAGRIPIRTIPVPFLLHEFSNDADPDGSTVIPPVDADLLETAASLRAKASNDDIAKSRGAVAADRRREFHIASAFGKYFSVEGASFSDLLRDMRSAGFDSATLHAHTGPHELDRLLRTLGPDDVLMVYGHGAVSESKGVAVGMSMNSYYVWSEHYPVSRAVDELNNSGAGGPGLILLAGCQTGDLVDDLDAPGRTVIGYSRSHLVGNIRVSASDFLRSYTGGATLGEAINATNAAPNLSAWNVSLVVNPSADLSRKFDDEVADSEPDNSAAFPLTYSGSGFMDVSATANWGSRSSRTLVQTVNVEVILLADNKATATISGTRALSPDCPRGDDSGGGINENAFVFRSPWTGSWSGTPEMGVATLTLIDQGIEFTIDCRFDSATISGRGEWAGTYPSAGCTSVTLSQRNLWSFDR